MIAIVRTAGGAAGAVSGASTATLVLVNTMAAFPPRRHHRGAGPSRGVLFVLQCQADPTSMFLVIEGLDGARSLPDIN